MNNAFEKWWDANADDTMTPALHDFCRDCWEAGADEKNLRKLLGIVFRYIKGTVDALKEGNPVECEITVDEYAAIEAACQRIPRRCPTCGYIITLDMCCNCGSLEKTK